MTLWNIVCVIMEFCEHKLLKGAAKGIKRLVYWW